MSDKSGSSGARSKSSSGIESWSDTKRRWTEDQLIDDLEDQIDRTFTSVSSVTNPEPDDRGPWRGDRDFLVASVGTLVGLGNIWKFPFLVFKNGGGAFLIPYFICVCIGGIPLIYLEVALGQYMSKEGILAWKIVPLFQGIALTQYVVQFYTLCYYNVVLAWAFFYLSSSFTEVLPWETCDHDWNTLDCSMDFHKKEHNAPNFTEEDDVDHSLLTTPTEEYWEYRLLGISDGIEQMGVVRWDLAFCLLFSWFIVYCCVCKGILATGKIMYVTTTTPYLFMLILLVKHCLLPGAGAGVAYYISPDFSRLGDYQVWKDAGTQVLFSSSVGCGVLTVLGSHNKFNHPSFRDSVIMSCVDAGTSFLFGLIVFTILGFMADQEGRTIAEVTVVGPGLAFIAYPTAVTKMPLSPLWSAIFFTMVILLGLDSQFVAVEAVVNGFLELFPNFLRDQKKDFFRSVACGFFCTVGLMMVTEGGMYVFLLFDHYTAGPVVLLIGFCELIAISHVYGIERFVDNVYMMMGTSGSKFTHHYLVTCWSALTPLFCLSMLVVYFIDYSDLTYQRPSRPEYHFPYWTKPLGWCMAASSAIWIPALMIYKFIKHGGDMKALKLLTVPHYLEPHQRRPQDENEECLNDYESGVNLGDIDEDKQTSKLSEHSSQDKKSVSQSEESQETGEQ